MSVAVLAMPVNQGCQVCLDQEEKNIKSNIQKQRTNSFDFLLELPFPLMRMVIIAVSPGSFVWSERRVLWRVGRGLLNFKSHK